MGPVKKKHNCGAFVVQLIQSAHRTQGVCLIPNSSYPRNLLDPQCPHRTRDVCLIPDSLHPTRWHCLIPLIADFNTILQYRPHNLQVLITLSVQSNVEHIYIYLYLFIRPVGEATSVKPCNFSDTSLINLYLSDNKRSLHIFYLLIKGGNIEDYSWHDVTVWRHKSVCALCCMNVG